MSTPIQAIVHAPTAPLWQRVTAYGVGWLFIFAGLIALNSFPIASTLLYVGAWIVMLAPFAMRRRSAKPARITVHPGRIEILSSRSFPRTLATRSLRGAALVQTKDKSTLWLAEASSPNTPITIEADDRGMKDIRKALGIRKGGFGEIRSWSDSSLLKGEALLRAFSGLVLVAAALSNLLSRNGHLETAAPLMFICSIVVSAYVFVNRAPLVKLEEETTNDTSHDEAIQIDHLKRGDASVLDWIARIDALASTQSEAGYRGAQIPTAELWSAVENHETAHDVRAAAARVLFRVSPEKSADRIAAALASIHDDAERAHLRAALDSDPEAAAREIEALDEEMNDRR